MLQAPWQAQICGRHSSNHSRLRGVVLLDLALAKGLEFDQVIVADAQEEVYKADGISRRRLYTAMSRAMHHVILVSQGKMTPL
ncbi:MAG: ATP-binding domain-containing protein, partial [Segatella oulorum]